MSVIVKYIFRYLLLTTKTSGITVTRSLPHVLNKRWKKVTKPTHEGESDP